jgi:hypothetical protein
MVSPLVVAVPLVGAAALYLLWPKSTAAAPSPYTPAPGSPALMSGGARALSYQQQINMALLAYRAAKLIGGSGVSDAGKQLVGTLDVVNGMTANDVAQKTITPQDKASIDAAIAAAKKELTA